MPDLAVDKLLPFLLVVLPGFVSIKVYDLFYPPEKRDLGSSLIEIIAYGVINTFVWFPIALWLVDRDEIEKGLFPWYIGYASRAPFACIPCSILFFLVSPALLAFGAVWLRNTHLVAKRIGWPEKTAWNDFFKRRKECWILFHLKSGKMLGGYFGEKSYASTYPVEPEVYVEEVWRVDDHGKFVEMVEGTMGMVIRMSDCERLEFLTVEEDKQCPNVTTATV